MALRITHTNNSSGHDGTYVYRSTATIDPSSLPAPIADAPPVGLGETFEYIDPTDTPGDYYYRTQDYQGQEVSLVSEEFNIQISSPAFELPTISSVNTTPLKTYSTSNPRSAFISPDGTKALWVNAGGNRLVSATMATPWDVSTLQSQQILNIGAFGLSCDVSEDGTVAVVTTSPDSRLKSYSLSTPFSAPSGTLLSEYVLTGTKFVYFASKGQKAIIISPSGVVDIYDLTVDYDVSAITNSNQSISATIPATVLGGDNLEALLFDGNGLRAWVVTDGQNIVDTNLATPWDVSSMSINSGPFSLGGSWTKGNTMTYKDLSIYIGRQVGDQIVEIGINQ